VWSSLSVLGLEPVTAATVGWVIVYEPAMHGRAEQLKAEQVNY